MKKAMTVVVVLCVLHGTFACLHFTNRFIITQDIPYLILGLVNGSCSIFLAFLLPIFNEKEEKNNE